MYEKYNAVLRFSSGSARYTVEELRKLAAGKEPASLADKCTVVPFLQQTCGWLGLGAWTEEADGALAWVWENKYTTTLHAINSAVLKLSKLTKAAPVYRGFTGATLPASFFKPNEENVCGGIEYGFSSTTTERAQAVHYAAGKASTVLELQMGMIDRGADISWLSQYPHEREVLLPPLTGVEAFGTEVEGGTLVVHARLSLNLNALTLEQVEQ